MEKEETILVGYKLGDKTDIIELRKVFYGGDFRLGGSDLFIPIIKRRLLKNYPPLLKKSGNQFKLYKNLSD